MKKKIVILFMTSIIVLILGRGAFASVSSVTLSKSSTTLDVGNTEELTAIVLPDDATNKNVLWMSSDESIVTVDINGVVTAIAKGTSIITARSQDDPTKEATCIVQVTESNNQEKFIAYDINTGTTCGTAFSKATINISDIDNSGEYKYIGADIAIFKRPEVGNEYDSIYVHRKVTDNLTIEVEDFGDISNYENEEIYAIGYRVLYRPIGNYSDIDTSAMNQIIEMEWKKIDNSYFVLAAPYLSNYISNVKHNQIIKTFNNQQVIDINGIDKIVIENPDTPIKQEIKDALLSLEGYNTFEDGCILEYWLEFDVISFNDIDDINIEFDFNVNNQVDVELEVLEVELLKKQIDESFQPIKTSDKFIITPIGRKNKYSIILGDDDVGNSMIQTNKSGKYAINYKVGLGVDINSSEIQLFKIRNEANLLILNSSEECIEFVDPHLPQNKNYIETNVIRGVTVR